MQANYRFLAAALCLSLSACETLPTLPGLPGGPQQAEVVEKAEPPVSAEERRAAQLQEDLSALQALAIPERQQGQLQLAARLIDEQRLQDARYVLQRTFVFNLSPELQLDKALLEARLALNEGKPDAVLAQLQPLSTTDRAIQQQILDLRAQALFAKAAWLDSVRERISRAALLEDGLDIRDNQQLIWQTLEQADAAELRGVSADEPELQGWAELQLIKRETGVYLGGNRRAINDWLARHPRHPLDRALLSAWLTGTDNVLDANRPLAMLLPLRGQHARAAAAIRDGLLAARYAGNTDPTGDGSQPPVLIYDTTEDPLMAYRQAVDAGAQLVIGPLRKEAVALLAAQAELEIPVLALNQLEQTPAEAAVSAQAVAEAVAPGQPAAALPANLYQFGLPPEQEVEQIIERAAAEGHKQALAMVPMGAWGDRLAQTLEHEWERQQGKLLHIQRYNAESNDFSLPIKSLLDIDDSQRRMRVLEAALGEDLVFEPRRRQDVDCIVIIAPPRQARLIKPQLRFHYAADLPVYATSHAYSGYLDLLADRDMNGLRFADTPWVLDGNTRNPALMSAADTHIRQQLSETWPEEFKQLTRFYALGVDAYHLAPLLQTLKQRPDSRFRGVTGTLQIDAEGRVQRQLTWANFINGSPRPVPRPDTIETIAPETGQQ